MAITEFSWDKPNNQSILLEIKGDRLKLSDDVLISNIRWFITFRWVLIAALIILQLYVLQFGWLWAVIYSILLIIIPLVYLLSQLMKAQSIPDYSKLSALTKLIMFTGILSMIFFRLYF